MNFNDTSIKSSPILVELIINDIFFLSSTLNFVFVINLIILPMKRTMSDLISFTFGSTCYLLVRVTSD